MRNALPIIIFLSGFGLAAQAQTPETPARLVVDTLYGMPVADAYRWLEDIDSEEVTSWFRAQGAHARHVLDALPGRGALLERIREIAAAAPPDVSLPRETGGRWFYTIRRAGEPVARGYVRDAWTGEERLLVDPATVAGTGEAGANTLGTYLPSPDGRLVLYGVTSGGSENVVLRVRDVASGLDLDGPIERNRWQGMAWWSPDGRTVFYVQLHDLPADAPPTDLFRDVSVLRHAIGEDAASDVPVFSASMVGEDDRLLAWLDLDAGSGLAFGVLNSGVELYVSRYFVAPLDDVVRGTPPWRQLFTHTDSVAAVAVHGEDLYALTRKGATLGRVVRTRLAAPDLATAETVLAESEQSLEEMEAALDGLYVRGFAEGANRLTRLPWNGTPAPVAIPRETSVTTLRTRPLRPGALLTLDSYTSVSRAYRYDPSTDALQELPLRKLGPYDILDGYVVETVYAPSHDGVPVPLTIQRPEKAPRDGSMPIGLWGYGAYGITDPPTYWSEQRPWFESGGAYATCHTRGGGYYGAPWHLAGQKATKPNTWLDFIACAEYLVREGYTSPERLTAFGGSAAGITIGRAITERPDLFAAAVIMVGVLDAVRFETTPNGPPNIPEFGSVATEEGFRALLAMSAMHHVEPGTNYPAVLLTTGLNDPRVVPWQPGKMAAALQAATTSGRPVLLRVDVAEGHSVIGGTAEQFHQFMADLIAFMMAETGMRAYQLPTKADR